MGEPQLNPSIIGALGGNNSLKRFLKEPRQSDPHVFQSDYFLSQEYIDQFKHEVKRRVRKQGAQVSLILLGQSDSNWFQVIIEEGDPTDGHTGEATCTDRWRAANADAQKGTYNTFAETGVFVSVCRHGIIWTIADMICSGEL